MNKFTIKINVKNYISQKYEKIAFKAIILLIILNIIEIFYLFYQFIINFSYIKNMQFFYT